MIKNPTKVEDKITIQEYYLMQKYKRNEYLAKKVQNGNEAAKAASGEPKNTINTFPKFQLSPGSFQRRKKHDKIEHIHKAEITLGEKGREEAGPVHCA